MTNRHEERARHVVQSFRELLSAEALGAVTENEFDQLGLMIREAIADELDGAAEQVEAVAQRLRSEAGIPELGL